jgi:hypothetical protein
MRIGGPLSFQEVNMKVIPNSLRVVEVCNGYVLRGTTPEGDDVFLAHLGDGVDGLPDPLDPDLPQDFGFELVPIMVECPECGGTGVTFPRATCGMWAGLMPWPDEVEGESCGLCDGTGEVPAEEAQWYEDAIAESFTE